MRSEVTTAEATEMMRRCKQEIVGLLARFRAANKTEAA